MSEDPRERGKRLSAEAAARLVEEGMAVGVGTGSTVAHFIPLLARRRHEIEGAVASSRDTEQKLRAHGIPVLDLNAVGELPLYVDGADECDPWGRLIKGGGGALTREKIIAEASRRFVCIIDASKQVELLGRFPLPVEVIPMARSLVGRRLRALGGLPAWREGFVTDEGNWILDVHGLAITDPVGLEQTINQIPGVVTVGLFARRAADLVIVDGVPRPPRR
ncbi:MAG: ribose-5-phosphate isomerase RpiA [Xanthomonadales bacterium]|nr:ribose-5-phosphate isomerase RpiA [Xanthomonadales bacterium]